jgi:hypothetical protein
MRERWGVFSVRDHQTPAPFVAEVLLYDRLVVPVPPTAGPREDFWDEYNTDLQSRCLDILGRKTDRKDGLALTVPWDASKRERFKSKMSTAAALATQHRSPDQGYYVDPFEMTRELIKNEFRPALPRGVSQAWTVAAYPSADAYTAAMNESTRDEKRRRVAVQISQRFLTPKSPDPKQELLKRAVALSNDDRFRKKRARLYEWQESVIEDELTEEKALEELESRVVQYNKAVDGAFKDVHERFLFTIIPISLGMTGAIMSGSLLPLVLAGAGGLVTLVRFAKFDRKPKVDEGDFDGAAMIHDAQQLLKHHARRRRSRSR